MQYEEIKSLLTEAKAKTSKGNYELAERLANDVLAALEKRHGSIASEDAEIVRLNNEEDMQNKELITLECEAILLLSLIKIRQGNFEKALEEAHRALVLADDFSVNHMKAKAWNNIGITYRSIGSYDKALEYYNLALDANKELGDKIEVTNVTGNIGIVYYHLGSYDKALEYYNKALTSHQELANKSGEAKVTGNIGVLYVTLGSFDMALQYYNIALAANQELGDRHGVARLTGNIGIVYNKLGSYEKALEYFNKAMAEHQELGDKFEMASLNWNIGNVYAHKKFDGYHPLKAEELLLDAVALSTEIGAKSQQALQFKSLTDLYEHEKRWEEAFIYYKKYAALQEEINVEETKKQDSIREQQKAIEMAKVAAAARINATTSLLHKVLPATIAERIAEGEENIADYFPAVSILFADIEGFTPLSSDMPAFVVVQFLNFVFKKFDYIMKKHGCEKIKTIGDGYMAVAGAPTECVDHAERITNAAIDMMKPIEIPDEIKQFIPSGKKLNICIGLHTGSVVAGVVGEERFVYDIYSDAVNTAARMESHGETGKIHVSSDFMRHLLNRFAQTKNTTHGIRFENRGEMEVKGKGMMKTYFLEKSN